LLDLNFGQNFIWIFGRIAYIHSITLEKLFLACGRAGIPPCGTKLFKALQIENFQFKIFNAFIVCEYVQQLHQAS
jgi:hypothetical protein